MTQATQPHPQQDAIPPSVARPLYRRLWFRGIVYAAAAYVVWCAVLYFYQEQLLFPADMAPAAPPEPRLPTKDSERLIVDLDGGGQIEAWFSPTPGAAAEKGAPMVVFCHGNAEIIDQQNHVVDGYHRLGCSVLLPEYRGYGRAAGEPSEEGIVADAVRLYDLILKRDDVDASRIVFHGRSLGGGVAAQLAARRRPAALILESTFTSAAVMAHKYFAPTFLARHPFRTDHVVADLDLPLLIFHGTRDTIIPVTHGRQLRDLARDAIYVEYDCGHNDFPGPGREDDYWQRIAAFLSRAGVIE